MLQLLLACLLLISPARAEEPAAEAPPSTFDKANATFAEWVVGPLASVMFFDLAFWDNTLPPGEGWISPR